MTYGAAWSVLPYSGANANVASEDVISKAIVINSMGGLEDPNKPQDDSFTIRRQALRDLRTSGLTAFVQTITDVAPEKGLDYFEQAVRDIGRWNAIINAHNDVLQKVTCVDDFHRAKAAGKTGIVFGVQNGAIVGDRVERTDIFANLGLRILQLTYNGQNQLGCGALVPVDSGLTPFGRAVVDRANANKLMVDLSHSGRQTCLDVVRYSSSAVSINHTGCSAINPAPRNKTDEELRQVAEKGGYVGIYTMPYLASGRRITGDDVILHVEHAIKVCGEGHVGIGTDNAVVGIDDMVAYMADYRRVISARRAQGISAPGEDPDIPRFAADLDGPDQFRVLARKMIVRGHSQRIVEKVLGGNFVRFAQAIWG
jgi:membrane dipeptidase